MFGYGEMYRVWLRDQIGHVKAERLTPAQIDNAFGRMRRGELSGLRRNRLNLERCELRVERSISEIDGEVEDKPTKTHDTRTIRLDQATVDFLCRHVAAMDHRAQQVDLSVPDDGFVFSLEPDCSRPMRPELMTRRMRILRKSLGAGSLDFDATILAMRKWTSTELMDAGSTPPRSAPGKATPFRSCSPTTPPAGPRPTSLAYYGSGPPGDTGTPPAR